MKITMHHQLKSIFRTAFIVFSIGIFNQAGASASDPDPCIEASASDPSEPEERHQYVAECLSLAKGGDPYYQFQYGLLLFLGLNGIQDRKEGITWIRKSAENGYKLAQVGMGIFLSKSESPEIMNLVEAYAWFAVSNEVQAMHEVGERLHSQDLVKAKDLAMKYMTLYGKD